MKRILVCFVFLLFSLFMVNADATYYVSVNGDNSNNGTSPSTPLKTLEEAWSKSAASSGNYVINVMSDLEFNGKLVNAVSHITIQSYGSSRYTLYPKSFGNAGGLVTILALGESSGNGSRTKVNNLGLTLNNLIFDGSKLNSNGTGFLITCHNEATGDCLRLGDNTTFQNFYLLKLLDCQNMRFEMAKTVKIINNRFATVGVNIGGGLDFSISGEISGNTITTLNDYNGCLVIGGMVPGSSISDLTIKNNSVTTNNGAVWLGNAKAKGIVYSGGVYIYDNLDTNQTQRNLTIFANDYLVLNSGSSFANGSKIGITLASLPSSGTAVSITGENSSDFSHVFVPTSSLYSIFNSENNVLKFFVHSQHLWTYTVKDSSIKAQCAVPECVYHSEPVSISLDVSNKFSLNTIISPENASIKFLFWSSSDESIATVENGVIEAKGLGDVVITASAADGSVNISDSVAVSVLGNAVYIH